MTAVMRSMSVVTGPKVLRIGVVQGGRVIEERVLKERMTITIGASESAMFVVPSHDIATSFKLFQRVGDSYVLNVSERMTGRIALPSGITTIRAGHAQQISITDDARGRIVVGDTTFLFQFVAPPPVQARPQLPLSVKNGLASQHDWKLTFIAAVSFLVHFGVVGSMYSDWADPIVNDGVTVAGLIDMLPKTPPPPVEVQEQPDPNVTAPPVPTTNAAADPTPTPANPNAGRNTPTVTPSPGPISDRKAAALAAAADALRMQQIASVNAGPSVEGALERSNAPNVDLGTVAERNIAVAYTNKDLKTGGSDPIAASTPGLGHIARTKGDPNAKKAGDERPVDGPTAQANIGKPIPSVPMSDADRVVANLRGRFRSCYQNGLDGDPTMSGKVVIRAQVGPNGEVSSSEIASSQGLSPAVNQCIAGVVKRATFNAPGGGGSTLQIPVSFVQQGKQ
jgi:TonB family protein